MSLLTRALLLAVLLGVPAAGRPNSPFPAGPTTVPEGLGVNIHFCDPKPGEMPMLAAGGFTVVRMDYYWDGIETKPGEYDFSAYDRLISALAPHKVRPIFILDYSNVHYDKGQSPSSDEGRAAFARWAVASVKHFRGHGVIWEMYNEPNISFWRPTPNTGDYIKLALTVGKAIRQAEPNETYVGPATSGVALPFLEECFKAGLLKYWDAVTIHPYRQQEPETATTDFRKLRALIARYAPKGKHIPIISGEWGYSSAWSGMDPDRQGKALPRQFLTNIMNELPISIWYDWHDDGLDVKDSECHFGSVFNAYHASREPVYDPKPAYLAAHTLTTELRGYRFSKRLSAGDDTRYVFLFEAAGRVPKLVAWTTSPTPQQVTLPASPGTFHVVGHTGESLPDVDASAGSLTITVTDAPRYLTPAKPNPILSIAAAVQAAPIEITRPYSPTFSMYLAVRNPLQATIAVRAAGAKKWTRILPGRSAKVGIPIRMDRSEHPTPVRCAIEIQGYGTVVQTTVAEVTDPLIVTVLPRTGSKIPVRVAKLGGGKFVGIVKATGDVTTVTQKITLPAGVTESIVAFTAAASTDSYRVGATVTDLAGNALVRCAPATYTQVANFAGFAGQPTPSGLEVAPDGDPKIGSTQTLSVAEPPAGPAMPGAVSVKLTYRYSTGWKFVRVRLTDPAACQIEGQPKVFGIWIYGDGSGNMVRIRFTDSTGQTFQPDSDSITWKGWRYITFNMDGSRAGRWGGANDGVVHYPIVWNSLFLLDSPGGRATSGAIYLSNPVLGR